MHIYTFYETNHFVMPSSQLANFSAHDLTFIKKIKLIARTLNCNFPTSCLVHEVLYATDLGLFKLQSYSSLHCS